MKSQDTRANVEQKTSTTNDIDDLNEEFDNGVVSRTYELKCELINKCLQEEIGFGRYQQHLFFVSGIGWFTDNLCFHALVIVLPQVQQELNPSRIEFAILGLSVGLMAGAITWGVLADLLGRKLLFNITLFIVCVFVIAVGSANNFPAFAALVACMGFGAGGSIPVGGSLFLEHIPASHQWVLALLSVWWTFGRLVSSAIAWGFIENYSCNPNTAQECLKSQNMGWRYTFFTLGCIIFLMFVLRCVVFDLQESSKYLISKGRDAEAIQVLQHLAHRNGKTITLTLEKLLIIQDSSRLPRPTSWQVIKGTFSNLSLPHIKPLFRGKTFALNTTMVLFLWGLIGLAAPLFNAFLTLYLSRRVSGNTSFTMTYRNYTIISLAEIPGLLVACAFINRFDKNAKWSVGGRRHVLAVSTLLAGVFLFLFTTSRTEVEVIGYSCASALTQNAMFAVLYTYTPEVFPAPHRGTADALAVGINRIAGILAPIVKITTTSKSGVGHANVPIFVSATLFIVAAVLAFLLPIETAGRAAT
ncbi:hypothetical protein AX15_004529 [Amanita polypyramis BW_CC]|nr:hypothetical protein AX15_004529 [Amanita polypyramis BW_CC]